MIEAGITGGIGSGKTTVCRIFESMGIPVYYADPRAKFLMYKDKELKQQIKNLLGEEAYHSNGRPNRAVIATKIFSDKELLKGINSLVHPAVKNDYLKWRAQQKSKYTLYEAALLVENNSYKKLDALIVVTAPESMRLARVVKRDNSNIEAVKSRMKNQLPESAKVAVADYLINNGGSQSLIPQIWEINQKLIAASKG